ncbi:unnamed protein product [Linum tenue]|uniref:Uncharacterized protein n=1 Tax=Linum tenue TaxID=586396 RepID=A0AAV0M9B2_9ROSI|nr:unnamed protein product [Linum tenue]
MAAVAGARIGDLLSLLKSVAGNELTDLSENFVNAHQWIASLTNTVEVMKASIVVAQKRMVGIDNFQFQEKGPMDLWLDKMKSCLEDIDDVLDEWATHIAVFAKMDRRTCLGGCYCQLVSICIKERDRMKASKWLYHLCRLFFPCCSKSDMLKRLSLGQRVKDLTAELEAINKERQLNKVQIACDPLDHFRQLTRQMDGSQMNFARVKGRGEEKEAVVNMLLNEASPDDNVEVISLLGLGGIGKTTIARMAFADPRVVDRFKEERFWIYLSYSCDNDLSKRVMEYINGSEVQYRSVDMNDSLGQISKKIQGRRFLFVFDNVWEGDGNDWTQLLGALRFGLPESKILVTSRNWTTGHLGADSCKIFPVPELPLEDCWQFFVMLLYQNGVVLIINRRVLSEIEYWDCAMELIDLWMAQGLLQESGQLKDSVEFDPDDHFRLLASQSIFKDVEESEDLFGRKLTFKIHKLIHQFASFIGKEESVCEIVKNPGPEFPDVSHREELRSLVVQVIDPSPGDLLNPATLSKLLTHLIRLRNRNLTELPEEICSLYHLETLSVDWCTELVNLPERMCQLVNLTNFYNYMTRAYLPRGVKQLSKLRRLSMFTVGDDGQEGMTSLDDLKGDRVVDDAMVSRDEELLSYLNPYQELEGLRVIGYYGTITPSWFDLLGSLRSIIFSDSPLWVELPVLGHLQHLELVEFRGMKDVTVLDMSFLGTTVAIDGAFPALKKLVFVAMQAWVRWTEDVLDVVVADRVLPCLKELEIAACNNLLRIPERIRQKIQQGMILASLVDSKGTTRENARNLLDNNKMLGLLEVDEVSQYEVEEGVVVKVDEENEVERLL